MGLFRNDGPQPWHPANNDLKEKIKECIQMCNQRGEFCRITMKFVGDKFGLD